MNRSSADAGRSIQPPRTIAAEAANEEWAADFKGWFRTQDQRRIDPLTMTDSHTRFLIETRITEPTVEGARAVFTRAFQTYGLPRSIRCDNGAPFGSQGAGGLTRLSAWWLKLGVEPHFIRPASPQENGRHERMHRTLKQQTSQPPAADAMEQQGRFDAFRRHYNEERPHEALGQRPPADLYAPSPRAMPERVEDPWYDADHEVRRVRSRGEIKWQGEYAFVSEALVGELVGLAELDNGDHVVRFCGHDLGVIDRRGAFPPFRSAPYGAARTAGTRRKRETCRPSARSKMSRISPVEHMPRSLTPLARTLRRNATRTERRLWQGLRREQVAGFRFRRQVILGRFIADFACLDARMIVDPRTAIRGTGRRIRRTKRSPATPRARPRSLPRDSKFCASPMRMCTAIWTARSRRSG